MINSDLKIDPDRNPLYDPDGNAFTDALFDFIDAQQLLNNKTIIMNQKNLEGVKKDLFFAGFGESLNPQVEKLMRENSGDFTVPGSRTFGEDKVDAVLHFKGVDGNHYFNSYDASIERDGETRTQSFNINSLGQSVTLKEAGNLLDGRAVFKEFAKQPEEGQQITSKEDIQTYTTWLQLDLTQKEDNGQYKVSRYHENYGFHLDNVLAKYDLKEMRNANSAKVITDSLKKGSPVTATAMVDGSEVKVGILTNPAKRELLFTDGRGNEIELAMKGSKQTQTQSQDNGKKNDLKNNEGKDLLKKNRTRQSKRNVAIS